MSAVPHSPAPWFLDEDDLTIFAEGGTAICDVMDVEDFPCVEEGTEEDVQAECLANARLIEAAPDHALILWAMCVAAGRWEPMGAAGGEFCINGICHSTKLDDAGCPVMTDGMRMEILKAKGAS